MPRYLIRASYSVEGVKGLLSKGGTPRRDAIREAVASVGGTLEAFYFAFGEDDVIILCDMPDHASAAAVSLVAAAGGGVSKSSTIVLLSPEEIDAAAKKSPQYAPPGT
jgi:uncharacterized protein with GYD domain